jgi:hypothetical protein
MASLVFRNWGSTILLPYYSAIRGPGCHLRSVLSSTHDFGDHNCNDKTPLSSLVYPQRQNHKSFSPSCLAQICSSLPRWNAALHQHKRAASTKIIQDKRKAISNASCMPTGPMWTCHLQPNHVDLCRCVTLPTASCRTWFGPEFIYVTWDYAGFFGSADDRETCQSRHRLGQLTVGPRRTGSLSDHRARQRRH